MPSLTSLFVRRFFSSISAGLLASMVSSLSAQEQSKAPEKAPSAVPLSLNLPGIEINAAERFVDVAGTICLESGALEAIACTKGTKEHEAIVLVDARPSLIHAALLLVGAKNGNPVMRRAVDKEMTRWVDIPAKGDPIYVSLVWKKEDGTTAERPISDFLEPSEFADRPAEEMEKNAKFPEAFLFAGSHLGDPSEKPRKYFAELSGNVISISTFGDELLCLPGFHGQENNALAWQINSTHLPKLNSKVTLRLRTVKPKRNSEENAAVPADPSAPANPGNVVIKEKLNSIIIPSLDFENVSIEEAVNQLRRLTVELDVKEADATKNGVNFVIINPQPPGLRIEELRLKNATCQTALEEICRVTGLRYTVGEAAILLSTRVEAGADPVSNE